MAEGLTVSEKLHNLRTRMASIREGTEHIVNNTLMVVEGAVGGAAAGFIDGKYGDADGVARVAGAPVNAMIGAGLVLLGYFGGKKDYTRHLFGPGGGFLAGWSYSVTKPMGLKSAQGASQTKAVKTANFTRAAA